MTTTINNNKDQFKKGRHVQICGLTARPEYNQLCGILLADYENGMERVPVQVELRDGTTKSLSLKIINLIVLPAFDPSMRVTAPAMETRNKVSLSAGSSNITIQEQRFETYDFKYGCRHGAPENEIDVINRLPVFYQAEDARNDAIQAIDQQLGGTVPNRNAHVHLYGAAITEALTQCWNKPENIQYVDGKMADLLLAMSAEELLDGDEHIKNCRRHYNTALQFRLQHEQKSAGQAALGADELHRILAKDSYEARTDRGLKRKLAKSIPCGCLDEKSAAAKSEAQPSKCDFCKEEKSPADIKKCSRCKVANYCSKECQVAHWRSHRDQCEYFKATNTGDLLYKNKQSNNK